MVNAVSGFVTGANHSLAKTVDQATEGAQFLVKQVVKIQGEGIWPVMPGLISSTDDSTIFAVEGMLVIVFPFDT